MPNKIEIETDAFLRSMNSALDELAERKQRALHRAGTEAEATAKRFAPVRTGRLRASITSRVHGDTMTISADAPYAEYVEFGTSKMSPHPFMRPALYNVVARLGDFFR